MRLGQAPCLPLRAAAFLPPQASTLPAGMGIAPHCGSIPALAAIFTRRAAGAMGSMHTAGTMGGQGPAPARAGGLKTFVRTLAAQAPGLRSLQALASAPIMRPTAMPPGG